MRKTVYILGAGASCSANLPSQADLLSRIIDFSFDFSVDTNGVGGISGIVLNSEKEALSQQYTRFLESRRIIIDFVIRNFGSINQNKLFDIILTARQQLEDTHVPVEELDCQVNTVVKLDARTINLVKEIEVTLEDLFTLFDNVSSYGDHFRNYSQDKMAELHQALIFCIEYVLAYMEATVCETLAYEQFADHIIQRRLGSGDGDFSVISMNWDDLLDRTLWIKCEKQNHDNHNAVLPDYCMYDYSIAECNWIPSIQLKARGYKNIKLLKLHGSLNWLCCPRCKRTFVDKSRAIAVENNVCPKCETPDNIGDPRLEGMIITPTFMKSLTEIHLRNIWHNAYMEISEADEIVFIGYSFPDADFEIRCLLKKAINPSAEIKVILSPSDNPERIRNELLSKGVSELRVDEIIHKIDFPCYRYQSFFGKDTVTMIYDGFEKYIIKERTKQ